MLGRSQVRARPHRVQIWSGAVAVVVTIVCSSIQLFRARIVVSCKDIVAESVRMRNSIVHVHGIMGQPIAIGWKSTCAICTGCGERGVARAVRGNTWATPEDSE
jgi:hypothetical protein